MLSARLKTKLSFELQNESHMLTFPFPVWHFCTTASIGIPQINSYHHTSSQCRTKTCSQMMSFSHVSGIVGLSLIHMCLMTLPHPLRSALSFQLSRHHLTSLLFVTTFPSANVLFQCIPHLLLHIASITMPQSFCGRPQRRHSQWMSLGVPQPQVSSQIKKCLFWTTYSFFFILLTFILVHRALILLRLCLAMHQKGWLRPRPRSGRQRAMTRVQIKCCRSDS